VTIDKNHRNQQGNRSAVSGDSTKANAFVVQVTTDSNQQKTIVLTGNIGAEVTLPAIKSQLSNANTNLLQELSSTDKIWLLNANLRVDRLKLVLTLSPDAGVRELRLRSQASAAGQTATATIDHSSFVYIRADDSDINIDNTKIFSWDPQANNGAGDYDRDPANGRAYLLAKFASTMNIRNSEIGFLGSRDGESYGLSWRDINDPKEPDQLRTRVTGEVINSLIHDNYYGIYTYQASNMTFRGNKFYNNILYGFDPHDFSHNFLVENNEAYNNGADGFIISRGCNNFIIRNNIAYNNVDPSPASRAHGFIIDPGSPTSADPQVPSNNNILENNEAYGNEGYGLRILSSNHNQIRNNYFHGNLLGISIDQNSTDNLISGNRINNNSRYGLVIQETANKNVVRDNEVMTNSDNGIHIQSDENQVENNTVKNNFKAGIALLIKTGFVAPTNNVITANLVISNSANGIDLRSAIGTVVQGNVAEQNKGDGVYLKDSSQTTISENTLRNNTSYGIEVNGPTSSQNSWMRNTIHGNNLGVIIATGGAILSLPPQGLTINGLILTGTAAPDANVEIFADPGAQAQYYVGRTTTDSNGGFSFAAPSWPASNITAISANTSPLSASVTALIVATPTPPVTPTPDVKLYMPVVQKPK
jgi:parallel beta-helix repeat protein